MGQVPALTAYLIIGDGRVARHLGRYFDFESIPYRTWSRKTGSAESLAALAAQCSHVLLAISDSAVHAFYLAHPVLHDRVCVHLSGALSLTEIPSAHPLMTFAAGRFYDRSAYRAFPFVLEEGRGSAAELLPGLCNPTYAIDPAKKGLYHALCALSGNLTILLWEKAFQGFAQDLGLAKPALVPYLRQVAENLAVSPPGASVLTGPIARGDRATIERHLAALDGDAFRAVYEAFVAAHEMKTQSETTQPTAHTPSATRLEQESNA